MNFIGYTPHDFPCFGGLVDSDDPTVLPVGVAALCRNCRFQPTTVATRYGLQVAFRGPNQAAITGLASLIYTPEESGEELYQVPMAFDAAGFLLAEKPAGSGHLERIHGPLVNQPANAHAIFTECYNRALIAFSNLKMPRAPIQVYGLKTQALDPYGQKPVGAGWQATTAYMVNEYVQPTIAGGNGHLYQCIQPGTSGSLEPQWPLGEGTTVVDGTVIWKENTPVLANRLPPPNSAPPILHPGAGTYPANRDVYVVLTYVNPQGESLASGYAFARHTSAGDAIQVALPGLTELPGWIRGLEDSYRPSTLKVYTADVATGGGAPPLASYSAVGSFSFGETVTLLAPAAGSPPPLINTARITPGGLRTPPPPIMERSPGGGTFPAGRDIYVIATAAGQNGETTPSAPSILKNTLVGDAVMVPIPAIHYPIAGVNLYEADVPTGSPAPGTSAYALVGSFQSNSTAAIRFPATGGPPPAAGNTTNWGGIAPNNGGRRYASIGFVNRNGNLSGIVPAFVSADIDIPGYGLYMANIPVGPENIIQRIVGFTIADGTNVGPFFYIPSDCVSGGEQMSSTVIPDNTSTTAFFNFSDEFLEGETATEITDRLRVIQPPPAVDVYYAPSIDRVVLTGVDGYASGHYISLAADSESFYGDTSPIQVANGNGQRCICAREYLGTLYSLKERSGFVISPNATDPSSWSVQQRWEGVGPCGPRAVAVTNDFLLFVHRSGVYIYSSGQAQPQLISKELPNLEGSLWSTINWDAQETIWCSVDEESKEIRIGLPIGEVTVPNLCLTLNYMEGLDDPIHFSPYAGKEIAAGAARKWSVDDIAAYAALRCERLLPHNSSPSAAFRQSQVLLASSAPDGAVHAITPGIYNDNGSGINCQYETVCEPSGLAISMLGGLSVNATGAGLMFVSILDSRAEVSAQVSGGNAGRSGIHLAPLRLTPRNWRGYSRGARGQSERFRCRFTNGKIPDAWFGLKHARLYSRPLFSGRTES